MRKCARNHFALACALGCVAALLGVLLLLRPFRGSFTIEGNATAPISPGVTVRLDVTLTNRSNFPITVTGLTVSVRDVNAPYANVAHPCSIGDFTVDQLRSSVVITVGARTIDSLSGLHIAATAWPQVGMRRGKAGQLGCAGASLTLDYSASRSWKIA